MGKETYLDDFEAMIDGIWVPYHNHPHNHTMHRQNKIMMDGRCWEHVALEWPHIVHANTRWRRKMKQMSNFGRKGAPKYKIVEVMRLTYGYTYVIFLTLKSLVSSDKVFLLFLASHHHPWPHWFYFFMFIFL